jgi:hypothetical protein
MEANLLTAAKNSECRELRADELDSVSGANIHMKFPGVDISINWEEGCTSWKFWRGSKGDYWALRYVRREDAIPQLGMDSCFRFTGLRRRQLLPLAQIRQTGAGPCNCWASLSA